MNPLTLSSALAVPPWLSKWLRDNLATFRSRFLLVGLAFTLAVGGLTILDGIDVKMGRTLADEQDRLGAIEHLSGSDTWRQRRVESGLLRVQAEGRLWEAESDGLAQANFQAWILEQANHASMGQLEIRTSINSNVNNSLKLRQLSAQVSGRFEAGGLLALLRSIASYDRLLFVNRLEVQTQPFPHFEMLLGTFLRPGPRG
jgi:membrane protein implicated in regulation of membrane protease activity